MKLGFFTAILPDLSFEQVLKFASQNRFSCLEVACWPAGKAERKLRRSFNGKLADVRFYKGYASSSFVESIRAAMVLNPPVFTSISRLGNVLTLSFSNSASVLLWTTNLQTPLGEWRLYESGPISPVTLTNANPSAFFRLIQ